MPILEGYFAKIDDYPDDEVKLCVASSYPSFIKKGKMTHFSSLAPSLKLLKGYKAGKITWDQYVKIFRDEMRHRATSWQNLKWLKRRDKAVEVIRLLCYEKAEDKRCHRFLLLDVLSSMEEE